MSASGMLYGPPVPASGAAAESLASAGHRAAMSFPVGKPISLAEASADVQQAVRAAQEQAKAAMVAEAQLASMAKAKAKAAAAAAAAVTSPAISGLTGLAAADGVTAAANTAAAAANRRAAAMAAAAGSPALASIQGMSAPMVSSAFARQQQQQLLQLQQSSVFASILARQSHAAKLAELAAVEYERAALDLEQATAAQQRQAQAVMAMSQVGGASPYEVAMVQAQMLGEQMRLQGQMMPGASAAIAATRTGGMMMPSMMALRAQQVQMQQQQQQQQSREAHAMQAPGQTKVSVAAPAPAQTPAPAPAPKAEQRQPQASSVAANGVKQTKTTAIAPETSTVDTKTKKGEAPSKSAMEDEFDAAEAVLSLMRGGVRRPSLAHQDTTKAAATATTTSNAVSEGQDKSNLAVKGQKPSKPTAAASTLFAPSAQMLLQAATLESTSTETAEGKTESKRKRASRRSSTDSKSSEASGDESGQGKKQKRTRSKKKPGQPRRPLSSSFQRRELELSRVWMKRWMATKIMAVWKKGKTSLS